jgi:hypothetical protein
MRYIQDVLRCHCYTLEYYHQAPDGKNDVVDQVGNADTLAMSGEELSLEYKLAVGVTQDFPNK